MKQLSEQQLKVLVHIAEGDDTEHIAKVMNLSPKTVEYHRTAVYTALNEEGVRAGNTADLIHYAIGNDLVAIRFGMKITYEKALKMLNLLDFELRTDKDYERIMDVWREATVAAREAKNDLLAADLSQAKEAIKKKWTILKGKACPRCQKVKSTGAEFCPECLLLLKGVQPLDAQAEGLYQVVDDFYIQPKSNGARSEGHLTRALRSLVHVGQSFITEKSPTTVKNASKKVGIVTVCRKLTIGEKDKSKIRFRVWRTDGHKPSEVNQAIKQRIDNAHRLAAAGQEMPVPTPEPPKAEEVD